MPSSSAAATTASSCAAYLAGAGLTVCVLERRDVVGGAAVTEEFHPGLPQLDRELHGQPARSEGHPRPAARRSTGSRSSSARSRISCRCRTATILKVGGGLAATQAEVAKFSRARRRAPAAYYAMLDRVADVLRELLHVTPPNVGGGAARRRAGVDAWKVGEARFARSTVRGAARRARPVHQERRRHPRPLVRDARRSRRRSASTRVVGNFASPYTPGSAYVLLHHVFGEVNGKRGQWGHAIGGMGAITQAMAAECAARGVDDPHRRARCAR